VHWLQLRPIVHN